MYQNFSSFLQNSLRFLNIANRVIPLVKDVAPQISKVRSTVKRLSALVPETLNLKNNVQVENQKADINSNRPTFFQ